MLTLNNEQRGEKKKKEERRGGRKKLTILSFFLGGGIQNVMVVLSRSTMHARRLLVGVFIVSFKVKKVFKTHTHTRTRTYSAGASPPARISLNFKYPTNPRNVSGAANRKKFIDL